MTTPPAAPSTTRVNALRTALREVIEACGGLATAEVSDEFLCLAPGEVRAQLAKAHLATPPARLRQCPECVRELREELAATEESSVAQSDPAMHRLATPPAATREAVPVPQEGAEISDEELAEVASAAGLAWETWEDELRALVFARAVLARWGGAAVQPVPVSEQLPGAHDIIHPTGECWWFEPAEVEA